MGLTLAASPCQVGRDNPCGPLSQMTAETFSILFAEIPLQEV